MQFIVTTHSPFVCQASDVGSVWRLSTPGTGEPARRVSGEELNRLIYGDILDAYSTGAFGSPATRSEKSIELTDELARLNLKKVANSLTSEDKLELQRLSTILPHSTIDNSAIDALINELVGES
jgi:hypothetical protein